MNMEIKIDKLNIQLEGITLSGENMEDVIKNLQLDKLTIRKLLEVPEIHCPRQHLDNIPANGAYILAQNGKSQYTLVSPEQFSSDYKAMGVAVIEYNKSLLVALDGFDDTQLIDNNKTELDEPFYDSRESAYRDFNGKGNTEILLKKDSPAAKLCAEYRKGELKDWWLPSLGEFDLMYRNKTAINKCLKVCGGNMLLDEWHWTSTPFSSRSAWIFLWHYGNTLYTYEDVYLRVRPISAFPELSL